MESSASKFPDWTDLPLAAVHLISEKLKSIVDYVRFRAVCSPWRSASLPKPHHLPPQLPWLMLPYDPNRKEDDGIRLFYDLWESKMRKLHLPETIGMKCCASYNGWLLLVPIECSEIFLLNPLTRAHVNLPLIVHNWVIRNPQFVVGQRIMDNFLPCDLDFAITKVTFSSDLTDPNCLITVFVQRGKGLFFCRIGDDCWTGYKTFDADGRERWLDDAAYHNGSFYLLHGESLEIYDMSQHKVQVVDLSKPELQDAEIKSFWVGKPGVVLVAVNFFYESDLTEWETRQIVQVYQISEDLMEAQQIIDTSDTAIFYGNHDQYLVVNANEWDSLNGSCLYMSKKFMNKEYYNILCADFNDCSCQPVVIGLGEGPPIQPPAPAMWFQPSFF